MFNILSFKEMQIKTTLRFHLIPGKMAFIKNTYYKKYWQGCEGKGMLTYCCWICELVQPLLKVVRDSSKI
jgi:hypothetical protein